MSRKEETTNFDNSYLNENDDQLLNLGLLFNLIKRNKLLISKFSIIFFILGCTFSLFLKRTWEGEFQIVLDSETKGSMNSLLGRFKNMTNLGLLGNRENLPTQVEILRSPSVLMPVFEFYKLNNNQASSKKESFSDWKKNMNIELERGTSVLNISYRDKNKSRIIPILEKTSFSYQKYSKKGKLRGQELEMDFLNNQIKFFKKKSSDFSNLLKNMREIMILWLLHNLFARNDSSSTTNNADAIAFLALNYSSLLP